MTVHISNLAVETKSTFVAPRDVIAGPYRAFFKRLIDVALVLLAAPVVLPLIIFLSILVAVLSGGKPFYTQERIGKDAKVFRMWKLRTMVKRADDLLEAHLKENPEARIEWETTQKLKNDPRVTSVGRLLRKTSIDELPQLFNVLNGSMSLVGPRPMMVGQEQYYHGNAYYQMRPGITGPWQVSDRNDCHFVDRVDFDNRYNSEMSFMTDLELLLKTTKVVIRATGY